MIRILRERDLVLGQPWYYGYAWRRYDMRVVVLMVIPFNFLAALLRQWWLRMRQGPRNLLEEQIREKVEDEWNAVNGLGYQAGREAGYQAVRRLAALYPGINLLEKEP